MTLRIAPTMLHSIDHQGLIQEVSDLWLETLGYTLDEVIGRPSIEFLSEESARYAREVVLPTFYKTGACEVEYEMRRKDGTLVPVRLRGVAVRNDRGEFLRSIAVIEDLTERRALERKMWQAQKLESLALMAGNIAHDFNNLLSAIVGNTQLVQRHAGAEPTVASSVQGILAATTRAADLCRQLLAYSGRGRFHVEVVDLGGLVRDIVQVLEVNIGKRAKLELALAADDDTRVEVDATQIRQIVMNLVLNAAEAMGDKRGRIRITTSMCQLDAATISTTAQPGVKPGRYVCLEVIDDGAGMSLDVLSQIFDPFFTTKSSGHGLGLAAVHGIVRGHRGTLRVTSTPQAGTVFQIYLPAAREASVRHAARKQRVLIVDDDQVLCETLGRQVEEAGYEPVLATSSAEALQLAATTSIDVYLIDVSIKHESGPALAARLLHQKSDARVVMMSGFDRVDMRAVTGVRFLAKPFEYADLVRALDFD